MKLSIVIINYKTYEKTISCLKSLKFEMDLINNIIIVDNGSGNNSLETIKNFLKKQGFSSGYYNGRIMQEQFILFQNENLGFAKGNNLGIDIAFHMKADMVLILNNDVKIYPGAINEMVNFLLQHDDIGCVGPLIREGESIDFNFARKRPLWFDYFLLSGICKKILPSKRILKHHFIGYNPIPDKPFEVDLISGSCMLFKTEVLKEINGFDPNTFLFYEEAIISEKLKKLNKKTYVVPKSVVEHEHAGTINKENPTSILKYSLQSQFFYLTHYRQYRTVLAHIIMSGQYLSYLLNIVLEKIRKK